MSPAYNFTDSGQGKYTVKARNLFHHVDSNNGLVPIYASSKSHSLLLSGNLAGLGNTSTLRKRVEGYPGCSDEEVEIIKPAAAKAVRLIDESLE